MATTLTAKGNLSLPIWRHESPSIGASAAGVSIAYDHRNDATRHPTAYMLRSATLFDVYDPYSNDWMPLASPALAGTFGAGACAVFHPSQGPRGTMTTGATTTSVILTTALPAAVGVNQLANRGDGIGFTLRMVGLTSGKTEERVITANTGGTTPTITVASAFSFTPASGDKYEILSGRVFIMSSGVTASGSWKYYDIATNSFSAALTITNLVGTVSLDTAAVALSELHVPNDRAPGSGFLTGGSTTTDTTNPAGARSCIGVTATSTTTLTASGLPSTLFANEYTNFQIRIVEDITTPAAVGQRSRVSSHTSGTAAVFTFATLATQPSTACKFVVENDDDKILLRTSGAVVIYNYNITANTWDTTTWAAPVANGAGSYGAQAFGISRDITGNARHSHIHFIRGAASNSIDILDIAGASTGAWANAVVYQNLNQTFTTGTHGAYDPTTLGGKYAYVCVNGTQRMARYDLRNRLLEPETYHIYPQGTALTGNKMFCVPFIDGTSKLNRLYNLTQSQSVMCSIETPQ